MTYVKFAAAAAAAALLLSGCAGTASKPTALTALSADQLSTIHIANITSDMEKGVIMTNADLNNINDKIRAYINAGSPGVMVDPSTGDALTLKVHYTRYDEGNAAARAIMIGFGQIHIDATVSLVRADGTSVGEYQVKKTFALGGIVGALTSTEDVQGGFAKSVAEIVKKKTAA